MSEPTSLIEWRIKKIEKQLEQAEIAPEFTPLPEWARHELTETVMRCLLAMVKEKYGEVDSY